MTSFINGAPIDDTGKLLVTTVTPTATWPFLGGWAYDPVTMALAVKDAVPAANDPWNDGIRNTSLGQVYVITTQPSPVFYVHGLAVSGDGRLFMSSGAPIGSAPGGWPIAGDGGIAGSGLAPTPMFFAPLMTTLVPTTAGNPTFTFARATLAYAMDQDGILRQAINNEARFQGARRVRNWIPFSQNLLAGLWTAQSVAVVGGVTGPTGLSDAFTITAQVSTGNAQLYIQSSLVPIGSLSRSSWWIRRRIGTGIVKLRSQDNVTETDITAQLDGTWRRFATPVIASGAAPWVVLTMMVTGDQVDATYVQTEIVDGQSNQAPSEYVSVGVLAAPYHGNAIDGVKYFATRNGNSVPGANLLLQSNSFATAPWLATGSPAIVQNLTGPDGATSGWTVTDASAVTNCQLYQTQTLAMGSVTQSIYVKKTVGVQPSYPLFGAYNNAVTRVAVCTIDTSNGVATIWTAYTGKTVMASSASCVSHNANWWRVSLTFTTIAAEAHYFDFQAAGTTNATQSTGVPDVAAQGSAGIAFAQVEPGSSASGYNPTTTAAVPAGNIVTEATGVAIPVGTLLGYVAENAATNLCLQSQTFDNAAWAKTNCTITANTQTAPDGTLTADTFTDDATNSFHLVSQSGFGGGPAIYTFSVYAKKGTLPWIQIYGFSAAGFVNVNLTTGAVGFSGGILSSSVTTLPNGWFRISVTWNATSLNNCTICGSNADINGANPPYTGTGQTMYLWGAQVEAKAWASSYIPTTTVAVVRNGDILNWPLATNADGAVGTAYAEALTAADNADGQAKGIVTFEPAGSYLADGLRTINNYDGTGLISTANLVSQGVAFKCAVRWGAAGAQRGVILNGGAIVNGAFDGLMNGTILQVGNWAVGAVNSISGPIKNVKIYNVALIDADLIALTGP